MTESIPKEIIGIVQASEWPHIKEFTKALLEMTLNEDDEYSLSAFNAVINNENIEEYDIQIKNKTDLKNIDSINDFEKIFFSQYSETVRNFINITNDKDLNIIIFVAKYMGPEIDHSNYFDFAIYLDSFNPPYFSNRKGIILNSIEILNVFNTIELKKETKREKSTISKVSIDNRLEIEIFEKLTEKNALWNGEETNLFQKWKQRIYKEFHEKTGGIPYYGGKISKKFESFLNNLSKIQKEEEPAIKEKKSAAKVVKSTVKEKKQMTIAIKPEVKVKKPATKAIKTAEKEKRSTTKAKKPATKAIKPVEKEKRSTAKAKKPATKAIKSAVKEKKPTAKAKKPATKAIKPAEKEKKPTAKAKKPATKAIKPAVKEKKPIAKEKKPSTKKSIAK